MHPTMDAQFQIARAEQRYAAHVAGAWLWLDAHSERALARGELPAAVIAWCRALRADRAALLRTARHQRRRNRR